MKKVLFVSMRGIGKRTQYAKSFFDDLNKKGAMWMLKVHGMGRWPSSRVASAHCEMKEEVTTQDCEKANYIILMDTNPPDWRDRGMYSKKIQHWYIPKGLPWEEQKKMLEDYVRKLVRLCDGF
ncbi:MAG: hypothetical protein CME70_24525 [Halobacteriovorax sp.]|nr:hypothetical protein [Halobacteriovorax sp.]|tara:strand:- start:873 stop:1241 length:369 start_codon:yes stop_codon:yes gene_type:complete